MRNRITAFLVTVVLILALGYAHGRLTDRWGISEEVFAAAARLDTVPNEISSWVGTDLEIGERQLEGASAVGYLKRRYIHSATGESVQVMILCGRPGPIAVHPPTVCFISGGVTQPEKESKTQLATADVPSEFLEAVFVQMDVLEDAAQRTYWGWSPDGQSWTAPDDPRMAFAHEPYLYKMYFTIPTNHLSGDEEYEPTSENASAFMNSMIAVLSECLKPAAQSTGGRSDQPGS